MSDGAKLIAAERLRQVQGEGWTPEHDDEHTDGSLAIVAACLAADGTDAVVLVGGEVEENPWGLIAKHGYKAGGNEVHKLAIAGALIAAEIDRRLRAQEPEP